ncbi:hypothetical protein [Geodermatophilus siccatus]|uniref:hypothetical protein n=1 Tax=Geodermatophilus siccatus TaxID=1137991 RepID=UPI00111448C9|nr:hypothetical protein [Geodermatophilus siccatus]
MADDSSNWTGLRLVYGGWKPSAAPQSAHVQPDAYVLAGRVLRKGHATPLPVFGDDYWNLTPASHRTNYPHDYFIDFTEIENPHHRLLAKEFTYSRLVRRERQGRRLPSIVSVYTDHGRLRLLLSFLEQRSLRLADLTEQDQIDFLNLLGARNQPATVFIRRHRLALLKRIYEHGHWLTHDRLSVFPWDGLSPSAAVGEPKPEENRTPRIPKEVMEPYLRGALFYVLTAAPDILAVTHECRRLDEVDANPPRDEAIAVLARWLEARQLAGRGLPMLPMRIARAKGRPTPDEGGTLNTAVCLGLAGLHNRVGRRSYIAAMLNDATARLGLEPGGLDTPITIDPETGQPWRARFDRISAFQERRLLIVACYVVTAFLSGMRDSEVQAMEPGCYFTEDLADGTIRHKVESTVYKGRASTGQRATWVVVEEVSKALDILQRINPSATLLFTLPDRRQNILGKHINDLLNEFRDHLNLTRPHDPVPSPGDAPWRFTTSQFRRTLAWFISEQPFGFVAGKRQFKHVRATTFQGYAGTSESGFRAEVEAEEAAARLADMEDHYDDMIAGVIPSRGGHQRLFADLAAIREELGDFPGYAPVDERRKRAMLANVAHNYYEGPLNACYYEEANALCRHDDETAPVLVRCTPGRCANSCITSAHAPAWRRIEADTMVMLELKGLSAPQRAILHNELREAQAVLTKIEGEGDADQ